MTLKTSTDSFQNSLSIVLSRLDKQEWAQPLELLASNFQQLPEVFDTSFETELLNVLWSVADAASHDADIPLSQMIAIRLSRILSFTVRASHMTEGGQHAFWNPLLQSYSSFRTANTQVVQASAANPPEDVIKRWSRDNLR